MDFIRSHKLIVATLIIQIIALPLILLTVKEKQETQTQAQASTSLYFTPNSSTIEPIQATVGQDLSVDLMIDPGNNLVSFVKLEINYNPSILEPDTTNPVIINTNAFPVLVEGPLISNGKIQISISVGSEQTNVIQDITKVLTLNMKAVNSTDQNEEININPSGTQLLSIAPTDTATENVLETSSPAIISISESATPTPLPIATPTLTPSSTPTLTPLPTATPAPPSPTPSLTPLITATPIPILTTPNSILNFNGLKLHGLGAGGDNPNPTSWGTLNPLRPTRKLIIQLLDSSGALVEEITSSVTYSGPETGVFNGSVAIPNTVKNGNYTIELSSPYYLTKTVPGFINFIQGSTYDITPITLVAGDVDRDNKLGLPDYEIIMDCYTDLLPAKNCTDPEKQIAADISDDGLVNQDDYNLFLRELSVQSGD